METARIPAGPILSPQDVLNDPHIAAKGLFQPVEFPGLPNAAPIMQTPVELSDTPGEIRRRAPTLGEHTDAILQDLGYTEIEIADSAPRELSDNRLMQPSVSATSGGRAD